MATAVPTSTVGRHEGEGDPVLEHRGEVAAGDDAGRLAVDEHRLVGARRPASLDGQASEHAGHAALALRHQGISAPEAAVLVPCHDPAEPRLQGRDAWAELVTVQRQRRFQTQRVARAEAGRHHARAQHGVPHGGGPVRRAPPAPRRPRPCSPCPRRCTARRPPSPSRPGSARWPPPPGRSCASRSRAAGPWTAMIARLAVTSSPPMAPTTPSVLDAFGITSNTSSAIHQTMMSSSTDASASSSRCVYCARPGATFPRSFVSARWSRALRVGALRPGRCRGG